MPIVRSLRSRRTGSLATAVGLWVVASASVTWAQPARRTDPMPAQAAPPMEVDPFAIPDAPEGWNLNAREDLLERIRAAAVTSPPTAARDIAGALLAGVDPGVAAMGLDTLATLGRAEGAAAVLRFLRHRRAGLRRHAVVAAGAIHTPAMLRALDERLGDPDPAVRAEAGNALGSVADDTSVAALWHALEADLHNTMQVRSDFAHGCAVSLARRGREDDVSRLLGLLRRAHFSTLSEAMGIALGRGDLPDAVKLRVVHALADLATAEARALLQRTVVGWRGPRTTWIDAAISAAARIR